MHGFTCLLNVTSPTWMLNGGVRAAGGGGDGPQWRVPRRHTPTGRAMCAGRCAFPGSPLPPPFPFPAPLRAADGHRGFAVFCRTDSKGVPQPWSIFWLCDRGCVVTGAKISPGCGVGHCGECGIRGAGSDRHFGRAETNSFTRGRGVHLIQTSLCVFN